MVSSNGIFDLRVGGSDMNDVGDSLLSAFERDIAISMCGVKMATL